MSHTYIVRNRIFFVSLTALKLNAREVTKLTERTRRMSFGGQVSRSIFVFVGSVLALCQVFKTHSRMAAVK